jgi:hypothetical protein
MCLRPRLWGLGHAGLRRRHPRNPRADERSCDTCGMPRARRAQRAGSRPLDGGLRSPVSSLSDDRDEDGDGNADSTVALSAD